MNYLIKDLPITPQEKFEEAAQHGTKFECGEDGGSVSGYLYKGAFYVCDVKVVRGSEYDNFSGLR